MTAHWPWWLGASVLSLVMLGFRMATGRQLGVSGIYARVLRLRREKTEAVNPDALRAALLKATRERFGEVAEASGASAQETPAPAPPLSPGLGATFVLGLFLGGLLSRSLAGGGVSSSLGHDFSAMLGTGWTAAAALLGGGALVGFGTQMCGGCTSGHGLNGCARLQPASLVATVAFFGAAVAISFLVGR